MTPNQTLHSLLAELKGNSRLRAGLWVVVGILWFYGLLTLREEVDENTRAYQATVKKLARTQNLAAQKEWPARLGAVRSLRKSMENGLWRQPTIGLAQANFQDWLRQTVEQARLDKAMVTVAVQDEAGADRQGADAAGQAAQAVHAGHLWRASAKIVFDFNPKSFYPFLERLATHEKKVFVESLSIRGTPMRAELGLVAYFHRPPESGAGHATIPAGETR